MHRRKFISTVVGLFGVTLGETSYKDGYFAAILAKADAPNGNGNIYPREVLEKAVKDFRADMYGIIGSGVGTHSSYSHMVTTLRMDNANLVAGGIVLDSPTGQVLKKALEHGLVDFRMYGTAHLVGGKLEDFKLLSVNAVARDQAVTLD